MPVDPILDSFYGTTETEPTEEELQKTASLEMLAKLAEDEGLDIESISDEDLMTAYNELAGVEEDEEGEVDEDEGDVEGDEEGEPEEELEKEAQEKVAEADTMGRIMAHSFVNELREINSDLEKTAQGQWPPSEKSLSGAAKGGGKKGKKSGQWPPSPEGGKASRLKAKAKDVAKRIKSSDPGVAARFAALKLKNKGITGKRVGVGAGIAAGLGAGAYGGKKLIEAAKAKKEKVGFDQAVEHRALQYLSDAGLMYEDGSLVPPEILQKQAQDVDQAALQLLLEAGYPVEQE